MANNIQIVSSKGRTVRAGDQVAPSDGSEITVDLDDPLVRRHLDQARGEWLQLDQVASGGTGGGGVAFADKALIGRWSAHTLPGVLNQVHTITPDGNNQDITTAGSHEGTFQLTEEQIAGTLTASQKLQFYISCKATPTFSAIVSGPTGTLKAGIARLSGDDWAADIPVTNSIGVDFTAENDDALFVTDVTADGVWFAPVFWVSAGVPLAISNGFMVEIALYAKIEAV